MDQIVRVIAKDAPVKAMAISARDTVERARAIHDCWPVASWSSRDYYGNWKAQHYYCRQGLIAM